MPNKQPSLKLKKVVWWVWVLWILLFLIVSAALVMSLLLYSYRVQTWAANRLCAWSYDKNGFEGRIARVAIDVQADTACLSGVYVADLQRHPMIQAQRIHIRFDRDSVMRNGVRLDEAVVDSADVHIITNQKLGYTNITKFVDTLRAWIDPPKPPKPGQTKSASPPIFSIDRVAIIRSRVTIANVSRPPLRGQFNFNQFTLVGVRTRLRHLWFRRDTVAFNLASATASDAATGWPLNHAKGYFRLSRRQLLLMGFDGGIGKSRINGTVSFFFQHSKDLSNFIPLVRVYAQLHGSQITSTDLAMLNPKIGNFHDVGTLHTALLHGYVGDFTAKRLHASFGRNTSIHGSLKLVGLPIIPSTRLQGVLSIKLHAPDIKQYLPQQTYAYAQRIGDGLFHTEIDGTMQAFATHTHLRTANIGELDTHLKVKVGDVDHTHYEGDLTAHHFNLGRMIDQKLLGHMGGKANFTGTGLRWSSAKLRLDVHMDTVEIIKVKLKRIGLHATLDEHKLRELFMGVRVGD